MQIKSKMDKLQFTHKSAKPFFAHLRMITFMCIFAAQQYDFMCAIILRNKFKQRRATMV